MPELDSGYDSVKTDEDEEEDDDEDDDEDEDGALLVLLDGCELVSDKIIVNLMYKI